MTLPHHLVKDIPIYIYIFFPLDFSRCLPASYVQSSPMKYTITRERETTIPPCWYMLGLQISSLPYPMMFELSPAQNNVSPDG